MSKLLNANFYRLKKNLCFWILLIIMSLLGVYLYINYNGTNPRGCVNCENQLGSVFFGYISFNFLVLPIFTSLFIGSEYSDGLIKNKIINGHKRTSIYLSNLFISIIVSFIYSIAYIIFAVIIGLLLKNDITISIHKFIFLLFDTILLNIAISSLFTFVSISVSNKARSSIISLVIVIWSMIICSNLFSKVSFASGNIKKIYEFFLNTIPYGQAIQILDLSDKYNDFWIYSLALIIIINFYGILIINRKEIN